MEDRETSKKDCSRTQEHESQETNVSSDQRDIVTTNKNGDGSSTATTDHTIKDNSTTQTEPSSSSTTASSSNKKPRTDYWKVKKILSSDDVNQNGKLYLSTRDVEQYIVPSMKLPYVRNISQEIFMIRVKDIDSNDSRRMNLRNYEGVGYVFAGKWWDEFVHNKGLNRGDEIGLAWNPIQQAMEFACLESAGQDAHNMHASHEGPSENSKKD